MSIDKKRQTFTFYDEIMNFWAYVLTVIVLLSFILWHHFYVYGFFKNLNLFVLYTIGVVFIFIFDYKLLASLKISNINFGSRKIDFFSNLNKRTVLLDELDSCVIEFKYIFGNLPCYFIYINSSKLANQLLAKTICPKKAKDIVSLFKKNKKLIITNKTNIKI